MTGTDDLRSEHRPVMLMLRVGDAIARRVEAGDAPDTADIDEMVEFFRVFVDRCHHGKEEDLLFPAMRAAGIGEAEPVIVRLLADHVQGRAHVRTIVAANDRLKAGDGAAGEDLALELVAYSTMLRPHIAVEDGEFFPLCDRTLPDAVQAELLEGYDEVERVVIGEGRHETFEATLDAMRSKYLG